MRGCGDGAYNHALDTSFRRSLPVALVLVVVGAPAMGQSVSFQRDVLPILSDRCFPCHGPDGNARQSKLRLDTESSALRTTDPVVVPHKSSESKLIAKITATDPGERMPPADSNLSLSEAEIETLKRWIDEGAHWERHWAFAPPEKSKPPIVADSAWPENGIDRFVLARLERPGLRPTPRAERGAGDRRRDEGAGEGERGQARLDAEQQRRACGELDAAVDAHEEFVVVGQGGNVLADPIERRRRHLDPTSRVRQRGVTADDEDRCGRHASHGAQQR